MRRYDYGSTATLRREVYDADGQLTDATVTMVLGDPDGEPIEVTPAHVSTGIYDVTVSDLEIYGVYAYEWNVSGAVEFVSKGKFYVADDDDELPPLASLDRFGIKLGYTPTGDEADRAASLLDQASELIRDKAGKTWVDPDTDALQVVPRRVRSVCIEVAYRAFANPEGLTQRQIGDSLKGYDRAGVGGGEAVYLTPAEEQAVKRAAGAGSFQTVTIVSPYDYPADWYGWAAVTAE